MDQKFKRASLTFSFTFTHQVTSALGIGRAGVYKLLESRQIKCFKIGNTYKIPKSALIAFVSQSCGSGGEGGVGK